VFALGRRRARRVVDPGAQAETLEGPRLEFVLVFLDHRFPLASLTLRCTPKEVAAFETSRLMVDMSFPTLLIRRRDLLAALMFPGFIRR